MNVATSTRFRVIRTVTKKPNLSCIGISDRDPIAKSSARSPFTISIKRSYYRCSFWYSYVTAFMFAST